jgi:hypothetical protein
MARTRGIFLLPWLLSGSFIISSVLKIPQFFRYVSIINGGEMTTPHVSSVTNTASQNNRAITNASVMKEIDGSVLVIDRLSNNSMVPLNVSEASVTAASGLAAPSNNNRFEPNATNHSTNDTDHKKHTRSATTRVVTTASHNKPSSYAVRPPLTSLIRDNKKQVIGDPQFLIDFAILGFPKTGSTSMATWIGQHPETLISNNEIFALSEGRPAGAAKAMYRLLVKSNTTVNSKFLGYKCPYDISNRGDSLRYIKTYWPKTKLIVGVRHPVKWFESFVNYRGGRFRVNVNKTIKQCVQLLCLKTANFHVFLAGLGKTNTTMDVNEMEDIYSSIPAAIPPPIPNKVFLYDMEQLADQNRTRSEQFGRDIREFIGLKEDMPPIVHENEGKSAHDSSRQEYFNICNTDYDGLRKELMTAARNASIWIRDYFLDGRDIYVSSRDYFEQVLQTWTRDPCEARFTAKQLVQNNHSPITSEISFVGPSGDIIKPGPGKRPPLSSLIADNEQGIIGDPQFLLDFAILGFPKTGSTSMAKWIGRHPETIMPEHEMFALSEGRPAYATNVLYRLFVRSKGNNMGYKAPYDVTNKGGALQSINRYWPKTRLIIGIRHPVRWLESFVNFRIQFHGFKFHHSLDGLRNDRGCIALLCTKTANFHVFLAGLGKTNATFLDQADMKAIYRTVPANVPPRMSNEIFLYDMEQLSDYNATRAAQFGRDVQNFLGLTGDMPPLVHENKGKGEMKDGNLTYYDICDAKYVDLRGDLMKAARGASLWIRRYFLGADGVHVSSRDHFEDIMQSWMHDPCDKQHQ